MFDETIRHLVQREANVLQADFLTDNIERSGREPVVHRTHHACEHRPVTNAGVEYAHRRRPRMDIGEFEAHPRSYFPLLRAGVHEEQILLPVVEETEIALRIVADEPGSDRRHGCRFHDGQNSRRRRLEQKAAARRSAVRIARHEGSDAIERVGRDTSAVAQTACELAVVDRTAAEGRFGEPPRPAKLADLLENLFVHGALPAGSQAAVMATSEPTPVPAVNYKYAIGKRGQGGWAAWPTYKGLDIRAGNANDFWVDAGDNKKMEYGPLSRSDRWALWAGARCPLARGLPAQMSKKTVSFSPCTRMSKR